MKMKLAHALLLAGSTSAMKVKSATSATGKSRLVDDGHFMAHPIDIMLACDKLQHDFKLSWDEVFQCVNEAHLESTTFEGYGLNEEQKNSFELDFNKHDLDGSGLIDVYELAMFIDSHGEPCSSADGQVVFNGLCIVDGKQPGPKYITMEDSGWDNLDSTDADHIISDTCEPMDGPAMAITVKADWMDIQRGDAKSHLKLSLMRDGQEVASESFTVGEGDSGVVCDHVDAIHNYSEMEKYAYEHGLRLPTSTELRALIHNSGNVPLIQANQWAAVRNPGAANEEDWIEIGTQAGDLGQEHFYRYGPAGWSSDNSGNWRNTVCYIPRDGSQLPHVEVICDHDEAQLNYAEMNEIAKDRGLRLPTTDELRMLIGHNGNVPLIQANQWAAVKNPGAANEEDWIEIGTQAGDLGQEHFYRYGPAGWSSNNGGNWRNTVCYVSKNSEEVQHYGHTSYTDTDSDLIAASQPGDCYILQANTGDGNELHVFESQVVIEEHSL